MQPRDEIADLLCRLYHAIGRDFGVHAASVVIHLLEKEAPIRLPIPRRA